jgi:hypothetical protein
MLKVENVSVDMDKINENEKENDFDNQHLLFERIVEPKQHVCSMYLIDELLPSSEQYNTEMSVLIQLQSKLNHFLVTDSNIGVIDDNEPIEKTKRLFNNMVKQSIYYTPQLISPLSFFSVFITILLLFINLLYIASKPGTRCIFWYIYIEHQMQFEV